MAINNITISTSVGIYPRLLIREEKIVSVYQKLLALPEFNGFTSFSRPQPYSLPGTNLGTLTSADNTLKLELSRASIAATWLNSVHLENFKIESASVEKMLRHILTALAQEVGGIAIYSEFLTDAPEERIKNIFDLSRQENLKQFSTTLTYPASIQDFNDLDTTYTITNVISDETWISNFPHFKHLLAINTSMRYDPERVLSVNQINNFTSQVMSTQTASKILTDITHGEA